MKLDLQNKGSVFKTIDLNYNQNYNLLIGADNILRTNLIEKIGSGIKRIKKLVPDVKFNIDTDWFSVIFKRSQKIENTNAPVNAPVNGTVSDTVNDTVNLIYKNILSEINNNKFTTINSISSKLNKSRRTIIRYLNKLKEQGIIKRVGSDKTGYWEIIKK